MAGRGLVRDAERKMALNQLPYRLNASYSQSFHGA
jgi:hypothetical protein